MSPLWGLRSEVTLFLRFGQINTNPGRLNPEVSISSGTVSCINEGWLLVKSRTDPIIARNTQSVQDQTWTARSTYSWFVQ